jgi:hypothetical protein
MGKFTKTIIDEEEGIVKQSTDSLFSPKPYVKYLDTFSTRGYSLPAKTAASMFSTPASSGGVIPPPPDPLYVAVGYVAEGYV